MFDTNLGSLMLQRLGFFSDIALKRTTNSIEIWRNILNPEKRMDGEAYGAPGMDNPWELKQR